MRNPYYIMDIAIITPLALEYGAVRQYLSGISRVTDLPMMPLEIGTFQGQHRTWQVGVCESGPKNSNVALCTERLISRFRPQLLMLTGIAGGIKDAALGDVVVGTKAYGYESGKETADGFVSRPAVLPADAVLLAHCRAIASSPHWRQRIGSHAEPSVLFGPIASGDKVIASTASPMYAILKQHYNDTLAIEMEAIGFAEAAAPYPHIRAINIRGVSDLLNDKTTEHDRRTQPLAAAHAAAFLFEALFQLDANLLNPPDMDTKTLAQNTVSALEPLLQPNGLLAPSAPRSIQDIWVRFGPLFKEAFAEEAELADALTLAKRDLRQQLDRDETLRKWLADMLANAKAGAPPANGAINVTNSKNVITGGGNITVSGDFHLGDK